MIRVKNYETASKFVILCLEILWLLFSGHGIDIIGRGCGLLFLAFSLQFLSFRVNTCASLVCFFALSCVICVQQFKYFLRFHNSFLTASHACCSTKAH